MATGGGPSPAWDKDRRESATCSLCLEFFTEPKALPCLHTFCKKCLEGLVSGQAPATFRCPHCRAEVTLPAEGVSAFPTNYHIRLEQRAEAEEDTRCPTHPKECVDLFCADCQVPVCMKCAVTEHKPHNTQNLRDAAGPARVQLRRDDVRLEEAVSRVVKGVEAQLRGQQTLQDEVAALKSAIREKYAAVVALAERCRDDLLARVDTTSVKMEGEVTTLTTASNGRLEDLCRLKQQLQITLTSGTDVSLVTLAKEMRAGKGSVRAVEGVARAGRNTVTRPVLDSSYPLNTLAKRVQAYFGAVETVDTKLALTEENASCIIQ